MAWQREDGPARTRLSGAAVSFSSYLGLQKVSKLSQFMDHFEKKE
jgi:hypothetical protein